METVITAEFILKRRTIRIALRTLRTRRGPREMTWAAGHLSFRQSFILHLDVQKQM